MVSAVVHGCLIVVTGGTILEALASTVLCPKGIKIGGKWKQIFFYRRILVCSISCSTIGMLQQKFIITLVWDGNLSFATSSDISFGHAPSTFGLSSFLLCRVFPRGPCSRSFNVGSFREPSLIIVINFLRFRFDKRAQRTYTSSCCCCC